MGQWEFRISHAEFGEAAGMAMKCGETEFQGVVCAERDAALQISGSGRDVG